jgi:hypothetical protein
MSVGHRTKNLFFNFSVLRHGEEVFTGKTSSWRVQKSISGICSCGDRPEGFRLGCRMHYPPKLGDDAPACA